MAQVSTDFMLALYTMPLQSEARYISPNESMRLLAFLFHLGIVFVVALILLLYEVLNPCAPPSPVSHGLRVQLETLKAGVCVNGLME